MFLELDKDELKEIVKKQIGTVKQLQGIQSQQKKPKVHIFVKYQVLNTIPGMLIVAILLTNDYMQCWG